MKGPERRTRIILPSVAFLFLALTPAPLAPQSIFGGEVEGRVVDEAGYAIQGAAVTLAEAGGEIGLAERTGEDGEFLFPYTPGGLYDLRVEALGYRPLLVVGLRVAPGDHAQVPVALVAEPPPVTRRDTVLWVASGLGAPLLGRASGGPELDALPDRVRDATGLLAASSWADGAGGLEGLPAAFTTLFAEGEPFRPAQHPGLPTTGAPYGLLFPRIGLQSATVLTGLEDIEWGGTAGGLLSVETQVPVSRFSGDLFGLWSGGATWASEVVESGPAMTSAWGGGTASVPLTEDANPLSLSFEGGVLETPNILWRDGDSPGEPVPVPPDPGTRTSRYGAGSARADFGVGRVARATLRGGFATFENRTDRPGVPRVGYGGELPGEGTDGSVAAIVAYPTGPFTLLEVKGSVNYSSRSWEPDPGALPGAFLVADRALLGTDPSYPASSQRLDLSITPVFHYRSGPNLMKGGMRAEYGLFDMAHVDESAGAFFFGAPQSLTAGEGAAILVPREAPSESFDVVRVSLFGQYRWNAFPGMEITTGLAWKYEKVPMRDIDPSEDWAALTGITNVYRKDEFRDLDGRVHLRWDLAGDGGTWVVGGMGVEHGGFDIPAMHQVLTLDGAVSVVRSLGSGLDWEGGDVPESGSVRGDRLAIFGPELKVPLTARASLGFFRNLARGVRMGFSASYRRTESILRRTDLNRLLVPTGTDQDGRPVYGDLKIVGGILAADPATNRRFDGFESVWALNADGRSRYKGMTVSVDAPVGVRGSVAIHYTYSQTRDNWTGAARGGALAQLNPDVPVEDWDEAISDFDIPHRLSALAVLPLPLPGDSYVSGLYTFRSSQPFTARVATGLDANGDGSPFNDVAFVPAAGPEIQALADEWGCIAEALGSFAERNACRADPVHTLDLRLSLGLPAVGGVSSAIIVDGLNLTDTAVGVRDENLLVIGEGPVTRDGDRFTVPYQVNPAFGGWVFRGDTGRMFRVGLKIGGGR